ncbi:cyclase family protein [Actinocrispum wychmicini]|uniref:Kynurenine formamidase n=1 Tax=Actinocrispum wychmicini TaxID=1213861 RepID=A0A4R2JSL1_9PSEU|nr:cyclase family protein [Actinocrispum wychmicini]TCO61912.1 kynurenine formamidase [Actinocrispum wychmicini]
MAAAETREHGRRVVDLSHVVRSGMITYPGLPGPEIVDHLSRADSRARYGPGTEFQIGRITMVANTGTYLDTPFHRYADGHDLATFPLSQVVDVDGVVVDASDVDRVAIDESTFGGTDVAGRAVLIRTGWSRFWGTTRYTDGDHPFLTRDAVTWLVQRRPAVVGIDSVNIDDMSDHSRPAHTGLLAAGIPIVEHMCGLEHLPPDGFRLHAAPVAIAGMGTFPVRVYAMVDQGGSRGSRSRQP